MQTTSQERPETLEILISTMYRDSLEFLNKMFKNNTLSDYRILIINQTDKEHQLVSDQKNIRVINSFEKGLSKSRNLALKNTIGKIALIADDDIVYPKGFEKIILNAHQQYRDAALISFKAKITGVKRSKKYRNRFYEFKKGKKNISISSWEISLKPRVLLKNNISFNECFGLGAEFPMGEEQLLLDSILRKNLKAYYVPQVIVEHIGPSSGYFQGSEGYISTRSAQKYLQYGMCSKFWLVKFVFFLLRHRFVSPQKTLWAFQVGSRAIDRARAIFEKGGEKNKKSF